MVLVAVWPPANVGVGMARKSLLLDHAFEVLHPARDPPVAADGHRELAGRKALAVVVQARRDVLVGDAQLEPPLDGLHGLDCGFAVDQRRGLILVEDGAAALAQDGFELEQIPGGGGDERERYGLARDAAVVVLLDELLGDGVYVVPGLRRVRDRIQSRLAEMRGVDDPRIDVELQRHSVEGVPDLVGLQRARRPRFAQRVDRGMAHAARRRVVDR